MCRSKMITSTRQLRLLDDSVARDEDEAYGI